MKRCLQFLVPFLVIFAGQTIHAGTLVQFSFSGYSNIDVELYDSDKPVTVKNFLNYVQSGSYSNSFLHRCPTNSVTGLTDFVLQGGNYFVANYGTSNQIISTIPTAPPIKDEFASGTRYSNLYGTIAMAKVGGNTNSATSSWFFNLNNNSFLDSADNNDLFCVFGHVLRGTNVLNQFLNRYVGYGIINVGSPLDTLPVNYAGLFAPGYNNLYYVNITILQAQVKLTNNMARAITWTSINGVTNNLEYSTNLPPNWQVLTNFVGTGNPVTFVDSVTNITRRFYRVHVLY